MWSNRSIDLKGHNDRPIHNRFYPHEDGSTRLAVVIAGFAYTLESPFLFYSKHPPFRAGWDVLAIDFEYSRTADFVAAEGSEQESWFRDDVQGLAAYLANQRSYETVSFIGKSIGTTALFLMLQDAGIREMTDRVTWLTPAQMTGKIVATVEREPLRSFFVYGDRDHYAGELPADRLESYPHVEVLVIPGADHALETEDPGNSVDALREYIRRLEEFYSS
jgi:pimeloyl-ACP methyl ester carboxylesterase